MKFELFYIKNKPKYTTNKGLQILIQKLTYCISSNIHLTKLLKTFPLPQFDFNYLIIFYFFSILKIYFLTLFLQLIT
jgi:hypothetical protein